MLAVFFPLFFRQPQTEFPAVTLLFHRPLQNQVRYKDLQVNLQKIWMVCDFLEFQLRFSQLIQKNSEFRVLLLLLFSISSNGCSAISAAKSPKSVASSVASSSSCVSLSAIFPQLRHYEILAVFLRSQFQS
jgi:hypothetical protein